ncbi:MAG: hypothetical protein LBN25_00790 [Christensenellaceae bacterium]|jgi:predicted small secreted protein|nr:hypothetical protein [Christensenellaceae bacterium]
MKRKSLIVVILLLALSVTLLGCIKTFDGYDDDAKIVSSNTAVFSSHVSNDILGKLTDKSSKFNGVQTIKSVTVKEDGEYTFKMTLKISAGRFKLVLVDDAQNVFLITDKDIDGDNGITVNAKAGTYQIRMVGEDAKYELTYLYI